MNDFIHWAVSTSAFHDYIHLVFPVGRELTWPPTLRQVVDLQVNGAQRMVKEQAAWGEPCCLAVRAVTVMDQFCQQTFPIRFLCDCENSEQRQQSPVVLLWTSEFP